jgi:hypothetical protein
MNDLSDLRLSMVIMAHPRRREQACRLQRQYPELNARVVFDPDPNGPPSTLRTARAAWAAVDEGATHHLVLQDDVILCQDFPAAVADAIKVGPSPAMSLFASASMASAQAIRLAALVGASWTRLVDGWVPTQALVLPAAWAREFADYAADVDDSRPDNRVMSAFLSQKRAETYVTIPNLVEHGQARSLLLNDLLHGVRESAVFADDVKDEEFAVSDVVADPPALSYMWLGGGEFFSCYDPLDSTGGSMVTPTHEVLARFGMSDREVTEAFERDRDQHLAEAEPALVGDCLQFSIWLTMFASGIIAGSLVDEVADAPEIEPDRPEASAALATFPAAVLRKMVPQQSLHDTADQLAPFCRTALESGSAAVQEWPELAALQSPDGLRIRPQWAEKDV